MQPTLQDNQLMSKHRVLSLKPHLRLEWQGQDGQNETEQPDHSASLGDSITSSTRIRFSVHTVVSSGLPPGNAVFRMAMLADFQIDSPAHTIDGAQRFVYEQAMPGTKRQVFAEGRAISTY